MCAAECPNACQTLAAIAAEEEEEDAEDALRALQATDPKTEASAGKVPPCDSPPIPPTTEVVAILDWP